MTATATATAAPVPPTSQAPAQPTAPPPASDPGWAPAVGSPASPTDPVWARLPGFEAPVAVATDVPLFAAPESLADDDGRVAALVARPSRLHPLLCRATGVLGEGDGLQRPRHSAQWLRRLLDPRDGDGRPLDPFGAHASMPSATTLFNAFVHADRSPLRSRTLRPQFERHLQVLARPGDRIASLRVEPGDLLLRVAPGQGWGHVAVIAAPTQCSGERLHELGWSAEDPRAASGPRRRMRL